MFDMYCGMYDASATAARQQWGSQGIYIPETTYFNGLEKLPDDIAAEMQDLYLLRKPWEQRSPNVHGSSPRPSIRIPAAGTGFGGGSYVNGHWVITERGFGPYGAVNHIFGSTAKIAYLLSGGATNSRWIDAWLRDARLPDAQGRGRVLSQLTQRAARATTASITSTTPTATRACYGARDTDEDLSAMRGVTAAAAARVARS